MPADSKVIPKSRKSSVPVRRSSSFNTDISPLCQIISPSISRTGAEKLLGRERRLPKRAKSFTVSDFEEDVAATDSTAYSSIGQLFYQRSGSNKSCDSLASKVEDKQTAARVIETARKFRQRSISAIDSPTRERLRLAAKEMQAQKRISPRRTSIKDRKPPVIPIVDENDNELSPLSRSGRYSLQETLPLKRGSVSAPTSPSPIESPSGNFQFFNESLDRCDEEIAQWYRRNSKRKTSSTKKSVKKPKKKQSKSNSPCDENILKFLICNQKENVTPIAEHLSSLEKCVCDCCTEVVVPWNKRQRVTPTKESSQFVSRLSMPSFSIYFDRMGVRRQLKLERKRGVVSDITSTPSLPDNYEGGFLPPSNSLCLKTLKHLLFLRCRLTEPFKKAPMSCDGYFGCECDCDTNSKRSRKKSKM